MQEDQPCISFRDTPAGRNAHITGTGLAVWEIMMISRAYDHDLEKTADYLDIPKILIQAAYKYAAGFPDEIEAELAENDALDFEALKRVFPDIQRIAVPDD